MREGIPWGLGSDKSIYDWIRSVLLLQNTQEVFCHQKHLTQGWYNLSSPFPALLSYGPPFLYLVIWYRMYELLWNLNKIICCCCCFSSSRIFLDFPFKVFPGFLEPLCRDKFVQSSPPAALILNFVCVFKATYEYFLISWYTLEEYFWFRFSSAWYFWFPINFTNLRATKHPNPFGYLILREATMECSFPFFHLSILDFRI